MKKTIIKVFSEPIPSHTDPNCLVFARVAKDWLPMGNTLKNDLQEESRAIARSLNLIELYANLTAVDQGAEYIELIAHIRHVTTSGAATARFPELASMLANWATNRGFLVGGHLPQMLPYVFYVDYAKDLRRSGEFIPSLVVSQRPDVSKVWIPLGTITWEKGKDTLVWHWLHRHCNAGLQDTQSVYSNFDVKLIHEKDEYNVYGIYCTLMGYPNDAGAVMASIVAQARQSGWDVSIE